MLRSIRALISAIIRADDRSVEEALRRVTGSHRWLAPLGIAVGAAVMLFQGLRLVFSSWRLTLLQLLPAVWIWLATFNLKLHALHGQSFHRIEGLILLPLAAVIIAITAVAYFLNAAMAFAILSENPQEVRPALNQARAHLGPILAWGIGIGAALAFTTLLVTRWGRPWFTIFLGIIVGVMMLTYVALPARLVGVRREASRRDKIVEGAVSGVIGTAICTPPYIISRVGVLMLGSRHLFIPGLLVMTFGVTIQAGATSAIKAVKFSANLLAGSAKEPAAANRERR